MNIINYPVMTLTYFSTRSALVAHVVNCLNVIAGKTLPRNGQMGRIFIILEIKLTPGVHLSLTWGYIHVYEHKNVYRTIGFV